MQSNKTKIKAYAVGFLLIAAGVLLSLFDKEVLLPEYRPIVFSWQSAIIILGLFFLFSSYIRKRIVGIGLIVVGAVLLAQKMQIDSWGIISFKSFWPSFLIGGGCAFLFVTIFNQKNKKTLRKPGEKGNESQHVYSGRWEKSHTKNDMGYINRNYVFGGSNEKIDFRSFKGGEINCIFGGMELDLTDAALSEGINTLEINAVFGGIVIIAPVEWKIEINQSQVFGNFIDHRPKPGFEVEENRILQINVSCVFGGGEIKAKNN